MDVSFLVVVVIVTALAFDFTNGFHDTANAMATSIATGALRPRVAVVISGILNVIGAFISTEVAKTISGGIIDDSKLTAPGVNGTAIIFAGLIGAVLWNLVTWLIGLPSSSSHALFGGLIGAVWVVVGVDAINFNMVFSKIILPALISPFVCGLVALIGTYAAYTITHRADKKTAEGGFRRGQTMSASMVSLAHGTGDAQKTMGVITLVLIINGYQASGSGPLPWVILTSGLAIGLGTAVGGWRIIRTMGKGLTDIESPQGFAAETASTAVLLASAHMGFALSTTQVCSGGILGAGLGRRLAEVRWNVAGRMALAWLFTLPVAALIGAMAGKLASQGNGGVLAVAVVALLLVGFIVMRSRRAPVTSENVNDLPSSLALVPDPAPIPEPAAAPIAV
ncbi:PiT family inorganic phosphate transporter [Jatrophihabitans sp. GAS493]|uniref:inorganic phosphate transporter n=1 Tax=Jatrophihabitans sp. GAS493 TaxID=1907575 RepID=UPI000BB835DA|nr:inorganic phosphate transporter [Jatrophihabitans sp. GAS493]SOD71090.1 PiT family inorganic phosphate transporter [Jatrophihabitans sp. GAS493]